MYSVCEEGVVGAGSTVSVNSGLKSGGSIEEGAGSGLDGNRFIMDVAGARDTSMSRFPSRDRTGRSFRGEPVGARLLAGRWDVPSRTSLPTPRRLVSAERETVWQRRIQPRGNFQYLRLGRRSLGKTLRYYPLLLLQSWDAIQNGLGRL